MEIRGCGSHSCIVAKPDGVGVNGPCSCRSMNIMELINSMRIKVEAAERLLEVLRKCPTREIGISGMTIEAQAARTEINRVPEREVARAEAIILYNLHPDELYDPEREMSDAQSRIDELKNDEGNG